MIINKMASNVDPDEMAHYGFVSDEVLLPRQPIRVMSSQSVNLTTLFMGSPSPLSR